MPSSSMRQKLTEPGAAVGDVNGLVLIQQHMREIDAIFAGDPCKDSFFCHVFAGKIFLEYVR